VQRPAIANPHRGGNSNTLKKLKFCDIGCPISRFCFILARLVHRNISG
jgi:hypothetical protein